MAKTQAGKKIVYVSEYTKVVNGTTIVVDQYYRSTPN